MDNLKRFLMLAVAACALAWASGPVLAQEADQQAIRKTMMAMFDKPGDPLKVDPVVVSGHDAVAGWVQGGRGGRAVLRKTQGQWSITVCGGDGLRDATVLEHTGMSRASATALAKALERAESRLDPQTRKRFSLFEGLVNVSGGHGAHPAHGAAKH